MVVRVEFNSFLVVTDCLLVVGFREGVVSPRDLFQQVLRLLVARLALRVFWVVLQSLLIVLNSDVVF